MALFKYFKRVEKPGKESILLPAESGPLSQVIPPIVIKEANDSVKLQGKRNPRNPYLKSVTPRKKAEIAKYATENGILASIRHFSKDFPDNTLKESTVRGWKVAYLNELARQKNSGCKEIEVVTLPVAKMGRPLLIGEKCDKEVQAYVMALREVGTVVNTVIVRAAATAILRRRSPGLLASTRSDGGGVVLTKDWARYLLQRMGFVKRKATTKAKNTEENIDAVKSDFLFEIKVIVALEEIPPELIINFDQTGLKYVPVSVWTMDKEGSKKVPIIGLGDKRQITAVFAGTMSGVFLPPQLIYKGKTKACLPKVDFPESWDITFTHNHWANEDTVLRYIRRVIVPYIEKTKEEMKLPSDQRALCIIDNFTAHCTADVNELFESHGIDTVHVPANCTGELQPMDISINKPVKAFLNDEFHNWYAGEMLSQIDDSHQDNVCFKPVQFPLTQMKPIAAQWIMDAHHYISTHPVFIRNGFHTAGITDAISELS